MANVERSRAQMINLMTQATYDRLTLELENARRDLNESSHEIGEAAGIAHDWHDNFGFEQATRDAQMHMGRVAVLEKALDNVQLIPPRKDITDVGIGNNVVVRFMGETETEEFVLLGPSDSGTKDSWISYESPLGSSLLGRKPGEVVDYKVKDRKLQVTVVKVLPGNF